MATLNKSRQGASTLYPQHKKHKHNQHPSVIPQTGVRTKAVAGFSQRITVDYEKLTAKNNPPGLLIVDNQSLDMDISLDKPHTLKKLWFVMNITNSSGVVPVRLPPAPYLFNRIDFKAGGSVVSETLYPETMHRRLALGKSDSVRTNTAYFSSMQSRPITTDYATAAGTQGRNHFDEQTFPIGTAILGYQRVAPYVPINSSQKVFLEMCDLFCNSDAFLPSIRTQPRYTFYFRANPVVLDDLDDFVNPTVGTASTYVNGSLSMTDYYILAMGWCYAPDILDSLTAEYAGIPAVTLGITDDRQVLQQTGMTVNTQVQDQVLTAVVGDLRQLWVIWRPSGFNKLWGYYSSGNATGTTFTWMPIEDFTLKDDGGNVLSFDRMDAELVSQFHQYQEGVPCWWNEKNETNYYFGSPRTDNPGAGFQPGKYRTSGNTRISYTPIGLVNLPSLGGVVTDYDMLIGYERYTEVMISSSGVVSYTKY